MKLAAIDIGTNTVLLLVVDVTAGEPRATLERATITRLGQDVDRTRELHRDARARTLACLEQYAALLAQERVERLDVVGTSALRDARGGGDFADAAAGVLGVRPRVISGDEEARLTFEGALSGLSLRGVVTVFDVGGGSTEICQGHVDAAGAARFESGVSLDVGSVRLHERHVRHDPVHPDELALVRRDVRRALGASHSDVGGAARGGAQARATTLVGVAGTVTTLAAIDRAIDPYDGARVHGARLTRARVGELAEELAAASVAERRALPGLEPARADVIVAGAVLVDEVVAWSGADALVVSDRGVRWGLVARLAQGLP